MVMVMAHHCFKLTATRFKSSTLTAVSSIAPHMWGSMEEVFIFKTMRLTEFILQIVNFFFNEYQVSQSRLSSNVLTLLNLTFDSANYFWFLLQFQTEAVFQRFFSVYKNMTNNCHLPQKKFFNVCYWKAFPPFSPIFLKRNINYNLY